MNSIDNIECAPIGSTPIKNDVKPENDITKISGIYKIINKINGHYYIGSSKNIISRWYDHRKFLKRGNHHSIILQRAWNKYGKSSFEMTIIELTNQLLPREQFYLDTLKPYYNINPIAGGKDNFSYHPNKEIIRSKMSMTAKNRLKDKTKHSFWGRKLTQEHKNNIRNSLLSLNLISPMKGKHHSLEARLKISQQLKTKHPITSVNQIDLNTKQIIKTWKSIKDAAISVKGKSSCAADIVHVCNHRFHKGSIARSAFGFGWEYVQ